MEQYGYTEEYYDQKKSGPVMRVVKIVVVAIILAVMAILIYRMWSQGNYPDSMEELYFNDTLTAHYDEVGRGMKVYTQDIRSPYDNTGDGNFFSNSLFLIPDADQLQVCVRYSEGSLDLLEEEYGDLLQEGDAFIFVLRDNRGNEYVVADEVREDARRYHYRKLIFDGIDFPLPKDIDIKEGATLEELEAAGGSYYLCIDVHLPQVEKAIARLPIYETHLMAKDQKDVQVFYSYEVEPYKVQKDEWPK